MQVLRNTPENCNQTGQLPFQPKKTHDLYLVLNQHMSDSFVDVFMIVLSFSAFCTEVHFIWVCAQYDRLSLLSKYKHSATANV